MHAGQVDLPEGCLSLELPSQDQVAQLDLPAVRFHDQTTGSTSSPNDLAELALDLGLNASVHSWSGGDGGSIPGQDRPIEEVFEFLADLENVSKWNYFVLNVEKTSSGPVGIGTTYHQVRKTDEQQFRITEFEPNYKLVLKTLPQSSPQLEMQFVLLSEGHGTHLRDLWKMDTGRPTILEKLAAGKVRSAVAENLGKLKVLLEEGCVVLQDGREAHLKGF